MTVVPFENLSLQKQCPVCGNNIGPSHRRFKLQKDPDVWMLKCNNCNLGTCEYLPSDNFLSGLYDPDHYAASLTSNLKLSNKLAANISNKCSFLFSSKQKISILDYGGGNGALCNALMLDLRSRYKNIKFESVVVDVYNSLDYKDISFLSVEEFDNASDKFDIVIASAVLEHLTNPKKILDKLIYLLNTDGVFYARTPYEIPLVKLNIGYKTSWPIHLHDMGPDFWEFIGNNYKDQIDFIQSKTSVIETSIMNRPIRTSIAFLLKIPSLIETSFIKNNINYNGVIWGLVGGWEVIFKKIR